MAQIFSARLLAWHIGSGFMQTFPSPVQALTPPSDNIGIPHTDDPLTRALDVFAESLDLARTLCGADIHNAEWQRDLRIALNNVGSVVYMQGRYEDALVLCEEAVAITRQLIRRDPTNADWHADLAQDLAQLANVLALLHQRAQACDLARGSLTMDERLVALAPDQAAWQLALHERRALVERLCIDA